MLTKIIGIGFLLAAACALNAHASADYLLGHINYGEFGVAREHPGSTSYSDVKLVEFGGTIHWKFWETVCGVGYWADRGHYPGTRDSAYTHYLIGLEPRLPYFYINYLVGPAYVMSPDSLLGSNLQVSHELGFGIKDLRDVRIGFAIKHFSNAGVVLPNYGRDFVVLKASF